MLKNIYVTQPSLPPYEEYIEAIKPLWDSKIITNMGKYHSQLELELANYLDVPEISLMVNGHMGLEMVIRSFEFPDGSEVITSPFTFISTTHAIIRNRLKPVFCDVKANDGTIDESKIENLISSKTVAIIPVHVYGNICNTLEIQRIADKYGLKVIYDAAHAFGIKYNGIGIGYYGDSSVFSFHATKVFNTVEGGAVVCKDHSLYEKLYNLKNFGIQNEESVVAVGANAKMNEFSAIMGLCNLKHINVSISSRKEIYNAYINELYSVNGITVLNRCGEYYSNYAYMPIVVNDMYGLTRDEIYAKLKYNGIYSRKYFYPLTSDQLCFNNKYKNASLEVARELSKRVLVLPLYEGLTIDDVTRITNIIKEK